MKMLRIFSGGEENNSLRLAFILCFGFIAFLSVAIHNGYPTFFSDSGSYLLTGALFKGFPPFRSPGYSVFTRLMSLGKTAWTIVAVQALIVVYVLFEICNFLAPGSRKDRDRLLFITFCLLTLCTSLPWLTAQIMPDVFAGVLFLSAILLAFDSGMRPIRRIFLAVIIMVSTAAHMSLLPIGIMFVSILSFASIFSRGWQESSARWKVFLWLVVPIISAVFFTAALNRSMGLGFRVSPSGKTFLLARLFSDQLAQDFLRANCPQHSYISCKYLANLPQSQGEFLFRHPLVRELDGHEDEISEIASGAILAHPFRFAGESARETLRQFVHIGTGDEIRTYGARDWNISAVQQVFPTELSAFQGSKQSRGLLLPLADITAALDTRIFSLSLAVCIFLAWSGRFARINQIFYAALSFLIINAAVCATFAGVYDRYQCRVAWILPFCLTAYLYSFVTQAKQLDAFNLSCGFRWKEEPTTLMGEHLPFIQRNGARALDFDQDAS